MSIHSLQQQGPFEGAAASASPWCGQESKLALLLVLWVRRRRLDLNGFLIPLIIWYKTVGGHSGMCSLSGSCAGGGAKPTHWCFFLKAVCTKGHVCPHGHDPCGVGLFWTSGRRAFGNCVKLCIRCSQGFPGMCKTY